VLLQETKLRTKERIELSNFKSYSRNLVCERNQIAHGGVAILAKPELSPRRIDINSPLQVVAVEVNIVRPLVLCSLYVQEKDRITKNQLQHIVDQLGDNFILGGDLNTHSPALGHSDYNNLGTIVEELLLENDMQLLNSGEATHLNKATGEWSTLDLTLVKGTGNTEHWRTYPDLANSDHLPILFSIYTWNEGRISREKRFREEKADWKEFTRLSQNIVVDAGSYNAVYSLTKEILKVADRTIPKTGTHFHRRCVPWWSDETAAAVETRKRALRRLKRNNNLRNLIELKRATAKAKFEIKKAQRESKLKLCESINPNTPIREVFQNIKKIQGNSKSRQVRILKDANG
jgi:endonuclease/exonuclease/phosphatase family metal-dependent hydrolase